MTTETEKELHTLYPLEIQKVDRNVAITIHNAIHDPKVVNITIPNENGILIPHIISRAPNGCRQLVYNGIRFIEQNKSKTTQYAKLAREGHKITWGIRDDNWICIIDGKITKS